MPLAINAPAAASEHTDSLRSICGSKSPQFNKVLFRQTVSAMWALGPGPDAQDKHIAAVSAALAAFKPTDEIEAMLASQAIAMNCAAMECFRRAMLPDQPPDIASKLRRDGANLARGMTDMVDALDRRRGKEGQQHVTVEHVHVHSGGKAIVGNIGSGAAKGGGRLQDDLRINPMHRLPDWRTTLLLAQSCPRCGAWTRSARPCRGPAMSNGRCRMHGGTSTGPRTAEGLARLREARTIHGGCSAEMMELRRAIAALRRQARRTIAELV